MLRPPSIGSLRITLGTCAGSALRAERPAGVTTCASDEGVAPGTELLEEEGAASPFPNAVMKGKERAGSDPARSSRLRIPPPTNLWPVCAIRARPYPSL